MSSDTNTKLHSVDFGKSNHSNTAPSGPSGSTQNVLFLDWDDTVMPTTYLLSHIDFYVDRTTKKLMSFQFKSGSKGKEDEIRSALKESGSAALRLLKSLYLYFVDSGSGRNLMIVTNGVEEWLWNSLIITGTLCPIYRQIEQLLRGQRTQIIYARNLNLSPNYWKMASFDYILDRFFQQTQWHKINVITIGDQWTDHCSIEMSPTFRRLNNDKIRCISHHAIKFFVAADAKYMASELNYIADLFVVDHNRNALLQFAANDGDEILMEFDGYHESRRLGRTRSYSTETVCTASSESPCTPHMTPTATPAPLVSSQSSAPIAPEQ